jgi:four helix bundle protein
MDDGSPKPRDLEQRTFLFAQSVRTFVKRLPRTLGNVEDVRQLVRSSGSVAPNWIEADEALSKKDFLMRAKICRKEAKESRLFLRLIEAGEANSKIREELSAEARELTLIFSTIISKASGS